MGRTSAFQLERQEPQHTLKGGERPLVAFRGDGSPELKTGIWGNSFLYYLELMEYLQYVGSCSNHLHPPFHLHNSWQKTASLYKGLSSILYSQVRAGSSLPLRGVSWPLPLGPIPLLGTSRKLGHLSDTCNTLLWLVYLIVYLHQWTVTSSGSLLSITSLAEKRDWINFCQMNKWWMREYSWHV